VTEKVFLVLVAFPDLVDGKCVRRTVAATTLNRFIPMDEFHNCRLNPERNAAITQYGEVVVRWYSPFSKTLDRFSRLAFGLRGHALKIGSAGILISGVFFSDVGT